MAVITFAEAIRDAIAEMMRQDESIFIMGEDIGVDGGCFGATKGLAEEFGNKRVIDTPLAEQAYTGAGIGAAIAGMRPIVEVMFSDFITVCFDTVVNEAPKMRYMSGGKVSVPITFRAACGCGTGAAAQHSQSLEAMFSNMPGTRVVMPSTPKDAKGLLKSSVLLNDPVIFLEPKALYQTTGEVPEEDYTTPLGKAEVKRAGSDVSLITYGRTVPRCISAAQELEECGVSAEVVDIRTLKPLDIKTIAASVKKTGRAIAVHEAYTFCGLGAEISSQISEQAFSYLKKPVKRLGAPECPTPFSKILEDEICPSKERIYRAVKEILK